MSSDAGWKFSFRGLSLAWLQSPSEAFVGDCPEATAYMRAQSGRHSIPRSNVQASLQTQSYPNAVQPKHLFDPLLSYH